MLLVFSLISLTNLDKKEGRHDQKRTRNQDWQKFLVYRIAYRRSSK